MQVDACVFVSHIQILNVSYNPVKQLLYEWRTKAMQQLTAAMGERDAGLLGAMILGDKSHTFIKPLFLPIPRELFPLKPESMINIYTSTFVPGFY